MIGVIGAFLLVSGGIHDAKDRKTDELHCSFTKCRPTWSVSILRIFSTFNQSSYNRG